ncbi:MAG: HAD family hydrolase [bacterium]|nr:HAD family hydrolase [bacterium]
MNHVNEENEHKSVIDIIAFDADDTLWHNESIFQLTHDKYEALLSEYHSAEWIQKKLFETEMRNLQHFGYGVKGFTLSMIETAIELTEGRVRGDQIQTIINFAREMVNAPVELLEQVEETIKNLFQSYPLMLITKGDLFDQESKIARSGLSDYFKHIEILSVKTPDTYREVLKKHNIDASRFLMVGNSPKSDILPVLEIGGHAALVPYHLCWEHERVDESQLDQMHYHHLEHIGLLPGMIQQLTGGVQ